MFVGGAQYIEQHDVQGIVSGYLAGWLAVASKSPGGTEVHEQMPTERSFSLVAQVLDVYTYVGTDSTYCTWDAHE